MASIAHACNNTTCIHGTCKSGSICVCDPFYKGETCEAKWIDGGFKTVYITYLVFVGLLSLILLMQALYALTTTTHPWLLSRFKKTQLTNEYKNNAGTNERKVWTLAFFILMAIILFCTIRLCIIFDLHGALLILPRAATVPLVVTTHWLLLTAYCLLLLYWVELARQVRLERNPTQVSFTPPILFLVVVSTFTIFPAAILGSIGISVKSMRRVLACGLAVYGGLLLSLSVYYCISLKLLINQVLNPTKRTEYLVFYGKVKVFTISFCLLMLINTTAIALVYIPLDYLRIPWVFITLNYTSRIVEFLMAENLLVIVVAFDANRKRKELPARECSSDSSTPGVSTHYCTAIT